MDPFIREVDEEYRRDRAAEVWKRYGPLILALAILVVASVGGWRYWQYAQGQQAEAAASRFQNALDLARDGKGEDAEKVLAALAADGPSGYRLLARFRLAGEEGLRNAEAGGAAYDGIAGDASVPGTLQDLARLRASMLRLDVNPSAASAALERIAVPSNPWRHTARELLGLAALKRGDVEAAGRWFDQIASDREVPPGLRGRLEIYSALVAGGSVQTTQ